MEQKTKDLLKKKIKDLTPAEIEALQKPLGTSRRPFPMWGTQREEGGNGTDLYQVLSVIADDSQHMNILSERSYSEVMAMAYCDMPVPSMLPLFFDGLERRKFDSLNRAQFIIGDPGAGKSFMGALQGRLRSSGPVEVLDCGGKNMRELLFEMVLDFGAGDPLPKAIDKRLAAGSLELISMGLLSELPAEVISTDSNGMVLSIDWNQLKKTDVERAFEILKKVSMIEGLDKAGGNALGMNSQYGPLIRKFIAGEEIVLDEYNKSREGTDDNLQTVWQFVNGEIDHCTVENPLKNKDSTSGPSSFTFRREDLKAGFFVTLTGNKTEDGVTTRSLNKSVYSRFSPDTLPDPQVIDWQHRICQMMVGMPVSTLYATFQETADRNPDAFGEWLMGLRKAKAEIEGVPVPELQMTLLSNWKNVVRSSEKLAKFYDKWAQMTDSEKIMTSGNMDLVEEIDDEYTKKEGIDFRKIKQHLEKAIPIRPRMQDEDAPRSLDLKGWDKPPKLDARIEEPAALHFGTRLTEFLERMVYEKSAAVGKEKLYIKLQKSMSEFALRDITLQEAVHSNQKSVEEDLNISAFNDRDLRKQAKMAQQVFCDYMRLTHKEMRKASDEDIVTVNRFHEVLKAVAERKTEETHELFVADSSLESLAISPVSSAVIEDTALYPQDKKVTLTLQDLVKHDDLIASLALPTISGKNLSAVWDTNIRPLTKSDAGAANDNAGVDAGSSGLDNTEGLNIAENRSKLGLGTTTLCAAYQDAQGNVSEVSVHIVRNTPRNKTLIIGEKVPSKLMAAFQEANIVYVDRHAPDARDKIEKTVADLTRGMAGPVQERLIEAFKFRNDAAHLNGQNPQFSDLLVDDKTEMFCPKYVVKDGKKVFKR